MDRLLEGTAPISVVNDQSDGLKNCHSTFRKPLIAVLLLAGLFIMPELGRAQDTPALHGQLQANVAQEINTIDAFDVVIGSQMVNTGPIQVTLDRTKPPSNQTVHFNFDTMTVEIHTDQVIHAPLLDNMDLPPQPIHIDETGPFQVVPLANREVRIQLGTLLSSGIISGGPFDGFTYSAEQEPPPCNPNPCPGWVTAPIFRSDGSFQLSDVGTQDSLDAVNTGVFMSPDGMQQIPITGTSHGTISAAVQPVTFFSDLGYVGNLYLCCSSWIVAGSGTLGTSSTIANPFLAASSGAVSQIDVAVSRVTGVNSFYVSVYTDNNGLPGTLLASFPNLMSTTPYESCCGLVTVSGISGLSVTASAKYWIVTGPTTLTSTSWEMWSRNNLGIYGLTLSSSDGGATWDSRGSGNLLGAFDILGSAELSSK